MLEKPDLKEEEIVACLLEKYNLLAGQVTFLPLGADQNSAVYRIVAGDETLYFLKLRRGDFDEISVALPKFLDDQGIKQVIAPQATTTGRLWTTLGLFRVILYPFVAGHNGYEAKMPDRHWREFGAALRRTHATDLRPALLAGIRRESFTPRWHEAVKTHLALARGDTFADAIAERLAAYLLQKRAEISYLLERGEQLARTFQARSPEYVLCHADVHAGNILIGDDGDFFIIDWDESILAPKERDLMSVGGALMGDWRSAQEEEALFYPAYGPATVDPVGIAYYRYERIIADIAVISEQIFSAAGSVEDRELFFGYLTSNFQPNDTIEMAYRADTGRRE